MSVSRAVLSGCAEGELLVCDEGLSFWGGVDPATSRIQDAHHPQHDQRLAGRIVMMPGGRGSCGGGGVLMELALSGQAPAALIFREPETILTLGAVITRSVFDTTVPIIRLSDDDYAELSMHTQLTLTNEGIEAGSMRINFASTEQHDVTLSAYDQRLLAGREGEAARLAMQVLIDIARVQGAPKLRNVTGVHIDGCIYVGPAYLRFAERMLSLGAKVRLPTTLNAISVDHVHWREQGVEPEFGQAASRLADCYIEMGAQPTYTCAPYLLDNAPNKGDIVGWGESNAVLFANSVLGARTAKTPDFMDLCIAVTGRVPDTSMYLSENRQPGRVVQIKRPEGADDLFWPMAGWLVGAASPDHIPFVQGLEHCQPTMDDLKAFCAAVGTTSSAPLVHIAGVTPEADSCEVANLTVVTVSRRDMQRAWRQFNDIETDIDLVAMGSPHFSADECAAFLAALDGRRVHERVDVMITAGRAIINAVQQNGVAQQLKAAGVRIVPDVCWCSITEPLFPPEARTVLTNSAKYAHYGPGLSGRDVRLASLASCAEAAVSGVAPEAPAWLASA
ncbi:MAG: aconitase X [Pseudomonadota bacterium]